ncbi:RNA-directed DNA polymerase [Hymenobacter jejuensis]|uniref:RNA-directed DNA polymerase n=1 Tax=Hymenobacter jejuensis TaxID=2502781 RepID=A0A5B8A181_9BACT|nr:RNA-directed DNA polymerase [Hymenobacter jejuensis]QDA60463.1 RNA-directed DNA polymerase [Hymenobacter jejuensis]
MELKKFLSSGYFARELPPVFTTSTFANKLPFVEEKWNLINKKTQDKHSETKCVFYNIPKVGLSRRRISIPNPLSQWLLTKCIVDNYTEIKKSFSSKTSASLPIFTPKGNRSIKTRLTYGDFRRSGTLDSYSKIYEIKTDISKYYNTIYTHIIPWVLHTKPVAKARRNDSTLLGNNIDKLLRKCQSGQTIGIPVGPDTSLIVSELIGCWIDTEFSKKTSDFVGYRYVDDFNFFFSSIEKAEKSIRTLQEIFTSLNLDMNDDKTSITRSPHFFDNGWSYVLANYKFSKDQKKQLYDIIRFFDISFKYSIEFPSDSVLKYSMKILDSLEIEAGNWSFFESLLMKTVITEPATLQEFSFLMYHNRTIVDKSKIKDIVYTLLDEHIYKGHSFEITWALWLAKVFNIKIPAKTASNLFELVDPCCLIMALDLRKQGLIASNTKIGNLQDLFEEDSLDNEYWLLVYEAIFHKWITPKDPKIIEKHPFFSLLKQNNISFYHSRRVLSKSKSKQHMLPSSQIVEDNNSNIEDLFDLFKFQSSSYF